MAPPAPRPIWMISVTEREKAFVGPFVSFAANRSCPTLPSTLSYCVSCLMDPLTLACLARYADHLEAPPKAESFSDESRGDSGNWGGGVNDGAGSGGVGSGSVGGTPAASGDHERDKLLGSLTPVLVSMIGPGLRCSFGFRRRLRFADSGLSARVGFHTMIHFILSIYLYV